MNKYIVAGILLFAPVAGFGDYGQREYSCPFSNVVNEASDPGACDSVWYDVYYGTSECWENCSICSNGAKMVNETAGGTSYSRCIWPECTSDSQCSGDSSTYCSGAYCTKYTGKCENYSCKSKVSGYSCNAGYYGNPTSASSGCTACESGATSPVGSTSHTACCYPSGTTFSNDGKGSGKYSSACCWKN